MSKTKGKEQKYPISREPNITETSYNRFSVRVSKRIGPKRQLKSRKQSNIRGIAAARRYREEFQSELFQLSESAKRGDKPWKNAVAEYVLYMDENPNKFTPSTAVKRQQLLEGYFSEWNESFLSQINNFKIQTHIDDHLKGKSPATKDKAITAVRQVFDFHIRNGLDIIRNPAKGISYNSKNKSPDTEIMNHDEVIKLLKYLKEKNSILFPIVRVAYATGMRSGELWALRWLDVNFEKRQVVVNKSFCWSSKKDKSTKSGHARTLPVDKSLIAYLKKYKKEREKLGSEGQEYVLPRLSAWRDQRLSKELRKVQNECGVTETKFHSIRASFVTRLLSQPNTAIAIAARVIGHQDIKTSIRHYLKLQLSDMEHVLDCFEINV